MFTELLTPLVGADWASLLATIIWIIIAILFLMVAWKIYLAFSGGINLLGGRGRNIRLAIIDAAPVDQKRRIVLVRRDGVEHLLMIGGPNDVVIEQGIAAPNIATENTPASKATAKPAEAKTMETKLATKAAPAAAVVAPTQVAADPLEDIFDSLISDRVAHAKEQQSLGDKPTAPAATVKSATATVKVAKSTPKPQPQTAPVAAPTAPKAPTPPLKNQAAPQAPVKPAAQPVAKPATQPSTQATRPAPAQKPADDISLEDEMQALIKDLQSK